MIDQKRLPTPSTTAKAATFRFGIRHLFLLTACIAISSWLVSIGYWPLAVLWLSIVFSFEIGRRSPYSIIPMMLCGAMMGVLLAIAITAIPAIQDGVDYGAIAKIDRTAKSMVGSTWVVLVGLDLALWLSALAIFVWFISVARVCRSGKVS